MMRCRQLCAQGVSASAGLWQDDSNSRSRQAGVALTAHLAAFSRPEAVAILPQVSPPATPQTELQPGTPGKPSAGGAVVVGNWASACVKHHRLACCISVQTSRRACS